jgi:hypothetical protein
MEVGLFVCVGLFHRTLRCELEVQVTIMNIFGNANIILYLPKRAERMMRALDWHLISSRDPKPSQHWLSIESAHWLGYLAAILFS